MNSNTDIHSAQTVDLEYSDSLMSIGIDEEFDELQVETPWEIFSSEMNNWNAINFHASEI